MTEKSDMIKNKFFITSVLFCLLSVIFGALGAHLLKSQISESLLNSFQTAVRYQMFHSITILILSINKEKFNKLINTAIILMILGVILFSFSIYLLTLQKIIGLNLSFLGILTPIGGLILISSWFLLLFCVKKKL